MEMESVTITAHMAVVWEQVLWMQMETESVITMAHMAVAQERALWMQMETESAIIMAHMVVDGGAEVAAAGEEDA